MATTPMTIGTFLNIAPRLMNRTSIMIKGNHGIGKSQIGHQIAKLIREKMSLDNPNAFPVIDRRLSQMSDGDIIGLPKIEDGVTKFLPPDWYMRACKEPCFLMLDEFNRATPEVMQAAFQIVLDRELNGHKLHPDTRIMTAVNASAAYTVNEIDPALLDRFWVIELDATVEDWVDWGRQKPVDGDSFHEGLPTNVDSLIVDFIQNEPKWLDPGKHANLADVEPSRRSWDRLSRTLVMMNLIEKPDDPDFYATCGGFIGTEASIAFVTYAKSIDNRISGEEILNSFDSVKHKLDRMGPEKQSAAISKFSEYVTENVDVFTDEQGKNLKKFIKILPKELRVSLWTGLSKKGTQKIDLIRSIHKWIAEDILEVFNVDVGTGAVGVGAVPKTEAKKEKKRKSA